LDQSLEKTHQELIFLYQIQKKNSDIKYLTYPIYAGGNRGRGQVYPTGDKSNMNVLGQLKQDKLRKLQREKGESNIVIVDSKGNKVSQVIPAGKLNG
jgi:apocytochrome f